MEEREALACHRLEMEWADGKGDTLRNLADSPREMAVDGQNTIKPVTAGIGNQVNP